MSTACLVGPRKSFHHQRMHKHKDNQSRELYHDDITRDILLEPLKANSFPTIFGISVQERVPIRTLDPSSKKPSMLEGR